MCLCFFLTVLQLCYFFDIVLSSIFEKILSIDFDFILFAIVFELCYLSKMIKPRGQKINPKPKPAGFFNLVLVGIDKNRC